MLELFKIFFIIGAVSFGGGYAIIPIIQSEMLEGGWLTEAEITYGVMLSSMLPGSIVVNMGTILGFSIGGLLVAFIATVAMSIPSFIYMTIFNKFLEYIPRILMIQYIFYGLRTVVISLILYAAYTLAISNKIITISLSWDHVIYLMIIIGSLYLLQQKKMHPIKLLGLSAVVGVIFL